MESFLRPSASPNICLISRWLSVSVCQAWLLVQAEASQLIEAHAANLSDRYEQLREHRCRSFCASQTMAYK